MTEKEYKALIDNALDGYFKAHEELPQGGLAQAMRYSLLEIGRAHV